MSWTRLRWSHRYVIVDDVSYKITAIAPWWMPLWLIHLWRRRGQVRRIREERLPRMTVR